MKMKKMSLKKDIAKLTNLTSNDNIEAKFVPLNGRGRAEQDRDMNNRHVHLKNGCGRSLYEEEYTDTKFNQVFDEKSLDDIRSSVRAVNGGEFSNEYLEQHIKRQSEDIELKKQKYSDSSKFQTSVNTSSLSTDLSGSPTSSKIFELESEENLDEIEQNAEYSKVLKNGVFRGLINKNLISMADLSINDTPITLVNKDEIYEDNRQENEVALVQHPDDSDLLVHPLQAGNFQYTQDFVLGRIGVKTIMTPKDYLQSLDDNDLEFVKTSK